MAKYDFEFKCANTEKIWIKNVMKLSDKYLKENIHSR